MPAGRPKKLGVRQEKLKKEEFLEVLRMKLGIISTTLKQVNITRWYYDRWIKEDLDFKEKVENITETTLDFVESKLFDLINRGDKTAIIFYLKCKGKDRGYIERQSIENIHKNGDIEFFFGGEKENIK
jgi:hypothetical protein